MKNIYSLKDLRKQAKMSQSKVAAAIGISTSQYRAHEINPKLMSFGDIEKLAVLFNISFNEMLELVNMQIKGFPRFTKGGKPK